nr:glucose/ribitol dehydrogenase [Tanacetum cinerariifolium]
STVDLCPSSVVDLKVVENQLTKQNLKTYSASCGKIFRSEFDVIVKSMYMVVWISFCDFLHDEKFKEELQDIENLTEERIDEIIKWFLLDFKTAKLQENGWPLTTSAYKVSKAALNAYARVLARKFNNIIVNCVHPGYVVTGMTCQTGFITAEEGAKGPVMAALLPDGGPSGVYFDQTKIAPFMATDGIIR